MIARRFIPPTLLMAATLAAPLPGCTGSKCVTECYEVCDLYCDIFGCWRECYLECYCVETVECLSNRDCARGDVCVNGDCRPAPTGGRGLCEPCTSHASCVESGALCVTLPSGDERVCGRSCRRDADCPTGFECAGTGSSTNTQCIPSSGSCGSVAAGCTSSDQCPEGSLCDRGSCVEDPGSCDTADMCQVGESCVDGECETLACDESSPCESGSLCLDGECRAACTSNAQCAAERVCSAGVCVAPDRVECVRNADCDEEGFLCVDATCRRPCNADDPCPTGTICRDAWCEVDPEVACLDDGACEEGAHCLDGLCQAHPPPADG